MKNFAIKLVWLTTIYVFVFAGLCQTNITLPVLMGLYCMSAPLILFMIYTILHDDYKTTKTFEDWYEDYPHKSIDK